MIGKSKNWDCIFDLRYLLRNNTYCYVNRDYVPHKYDKCYPWYCILMSVPDNNHTSYLMLGVDEYGLVYLGDMCKGHANPHGFVRSYTTAILSEIDLYRKFMNEKDINMLNEEELGWNKNI